MLSFSSVSNFFMWLFILFPSPFLISCFSISFYGLEFILHALGPLFKHFQNIFFLSLAKFTLEVLCLMECLPLSTNQPANTSRPRKWCLPFLCHINIQNPTSCNLFQIWLLTPLPNGLLHECPTKSFKTNLSYLSHQKYDLLIVFDWNIMSIKTL